MRRYKKVAVFLVALVMVVNFPIAVFAQEGASGGAVTKREEIRREAEARRDQVRQEAEARREEIRQNREEATVERLHKMGDRLIDQRIRVLNKSLALVNKATRVSEDERAAIIADINDNISRLTALRAEIDADTNPESLKAKIKSIFTDFRIYAVVLPRDRGLVAAGRANAVMGRLNALAAKMDRWLAAAKAKGKNTTSVESLITDFKANLAEAEAKVTEAISYFNQMEPARDLSDAKANLAAGKAAMRTARQNLKKAQEDLRKIIKEFKGLRLGTINDSTVTIQ